MSATRQVSPLIELQAKKNLTRHCDQLPHNEFCVHVGSVFTTNIRANELRTVSNNALWQCTYTTKLEDNMSTVSDCWRF